MKPWKVILINYAFESRDNFNYVYAYIEKYFQVILCIVFFNMKSFRKESFNKLREILKK
jgi:hypothetical protein